MHHNRLWMLMVLQCGLSRYLQSLNTKEKIKNKIKIIYLKFSHESFRLPKNPNKNLLDTPAEPCYPEGECQRTRKNMIIKDKDAAARLASPLNLMNRLKSASGRKSAMSLFIPPVKQKQLIDTPLETPIVPFNPFTTPTIEPQETQSSSAAPSLGQSLTAAPIESITTLDSILDNSDSQIKLGLAHDKALELLNSSVDMLSAKLDDIRADRLPSVVASASKVVESIRKERSDNSRNKKDQEVHYHFYTPQQKSLTDYEVIDVVGR